MPSIGASLKDARTALKQALTLDEREASLEASMLLGHAVGKNRAWLLAHDQDLLEASQAASFQTLLTRRLSGEPVAYILCEREFYGLPLQVTPAVLIPRQDTELLVELALAFIPDRANYSILDLGTGSGAIAIAIAKHRPGARITAVDQSATALAVAQNNAKRLAIANIRFLQGNWFAALAGDEQFDLIVSNPPYIAENDPHLAQGDLRYEPTSALASGPDGLDAIRAIASKAQNYLKPGGVLLLEHGFEQAHACQQILQLNVFEGIQNHKDLAGLDRATSAKKPALPV